MIKHGRIDVLTCATENQDKLFELMSHIAQHLESIDDCLYFIVSKEVDSLTKVWVTELWTSQEAHDSSLADVSAELRKVIDDAMSLVTYEQERAYLVPVLGKGISRE